MAAMHTYTFSSETHLWHRHLQSHPPFSLLWRQRRQTPLTLSFLFLPLFCRLSLIQSAHVLCSLFGFFLLLISFFFQSRRGSRCGSMSSWGPGTPSVRGARVASSSISLPGLGPFLAPFLVLFPGMWTRTAYAPFVWSSCGGDPFGVLPGPRNIYLDLLPKINLVAFWYWTTWSVCTFCKLITF